MHPINEVCHFLCAIYRKSNFANYFSSVAAATLDIFIYFKRTSKISFNDKGAAVIVCYQCLKYFGFHLMILAYAVTCFSKSNYLNIGRNRNRTHIRLCIR